MRRVRKPAAAVAAVACAASLAVLASQRGASPASAEYGPTPFEVSAYGCIVGQGGHRTVPPGSTIVIPAGLQ